MTFGGRRSRTLGASNQSGTGWGSPNVVGSSIVITTDFSYAFVTRGGTVTRTIALVRTNFTGTVSLSVAGLPTGVTGAFSDATLTGAELSSVLTLTAAADAPEVTLDAFTITASGSGVADSVINYAVTVSAELHYGTAELPTGANWYTSTNSGGGGTTHTPANGDALAALLTGGSLAGGDTIVLTDGVNYNTTSSGTEPVHFPKIAGATKTNFILVRTSDLASIPAAGGRVNDTHALATPHFRCPYNNALAISIDPEAHGWRFLGIRFGSGSISQGAGAVFLGQKNEGDYNLGNIAAFNATFFRKGAFVNWDNVGYISLTNGNYQNRPDLSPTFWKVYQESDLPDGIVLDRCHIASTYAQAQSTLLGMECKAAAVVGCHIASEGRTTPVETKAFSCVNGVGPFQVENNYISAPGINFLIGGALPAFTTAIATNCVFRRNHVKKRTEWNAYGGSHDGNSRVIKNLFELKVGLRWLIEDNLFENGWDGGVSQQYGIVLKVSNGVDFPGAPGFDQAETGNVTIRYNRFKNFGAGLFAIGTIDTYNEPNTSDETKVGDVVHDISIYRNYTETPYGTEAGATNRAWLALLEPRLRNLHWENNTFVPNFSADARGFTMGSTARPNGLVARNNVFGVNGNFQGDSATFIGTAQFGGTGSSGEANVLYDPGAVISTASHTSPTFNVKTAAADVFTNYAGGNYRTAAALSGTGFGGRTPGADIDTILSRTSGCESGNW